MPLYATQNFSSAAASVNSDTAARRLRAVPFHGPHLRNRLYPVAALLPTLRPREEEKAIPHLFHNAIRWGDELYVGDDAVEISRRLEEWLRRTKKTAEMGRLARFRIAFCSGLSGLPSSLFDYIETLRLKPLLTSEVLPHVMLNADTLPTDIPAWAKAFAIVNARAFELEPLIEQELETM